MPQTLSELVASIQMLPSGAAIKAEYDALVGNHIDGVERCAQCHSTDYDIVGWASPVLVQCGNCHHTVCGPTRKAAVEAWNKEPR